MAPDRSIVTVVDLNAGLPNQGVAAICAAVERAGAQPRVVDLRVQGRLPGAPGRAVVLTGGPGSPIEAAPWRRRLVAALPSLARRVPVLGICLGFQVMAHAWGWRLAPLPRPRFGVYPLPMGTRADHWLTGLPPGAGIFEQRRWAAWPVAHAQGRILAQGPDGDALAVRFGPLAAGVVFHPEAAAGPVARWLAHDPAARQRADRLHGVGWADRQVARAPTLTPTFDAVLPAFLTTALHRELV